MHRLCACLASALILTFSTPGFAKTLKIATLSPEGSVWMTIMKQAADEVASKTQERVKIRFYPGGVMGNDAAVLKKIRIGQLHGAAVSGGALSKMAPDTQIYNLPLLFNSYAEVDYLRNQLDAEIEAGFRAAGFVSYGLAEGGFAYIMSKKPISDVEDLRKNKVWVPSNDPASDAATQTFNIAPTPLALGDVLAGLQTDLVNTISSSPIAAIALQWHTQVSYITDLPLLYFYAMMVIDDKALNGISAEDQAVINTSFRNAFTTINAQNRKDNDAAFAALQQQGIQLVKPSAEELSEWEKKTAESVDTFLKKGGISLAAYNRIQQVLQEYRQQQAQHAQ